MPNPDLEIRGGGGGGGGGGVGRFPQKSFSALLRIKGGGPPPAWSLPWIRHYIMIFGSLLLVLIPVWWCMG